MARFSLRYLAYSLSWPVPLADPLPDTCRFACGRESIFTALLRILPPEAPGWSIGAAKRAEGTVMEAKRA